MKRFLALFLSVVLTLSLCACAKTETPSDESVQNGESQSETSEKSSESSESTPADEVSKQTGTLSVLFTNDVHCNIDGSMGYASVAVAKAAIESAGGEVILVDVGDCIQGGIWGTLSKGEAVIDVMNSIGYEVMTLGNHEFDYGIDRLLELRDKAEFKMVSCNFEDADGNLMFEPYTMIERAGVKIAFVGVSTPITPTSSTPAFFQDDAGNFIYSFLGDGTGEMLAERISETAAEAREAGADYVIALGHLGIDYSTSPYTSSEIIPMISGVDVFLDGHSHSVLEYSEVKDKDGKTVVVSQTGTGLENIGLLTISADGSFKTAFIGNSAVRGALSEQNQAIEETANQVTAGTGVDLRVSDPETDERLIRLVETNLGDLVADAIRAYAGADIGIANGGGIRVNLDAGDITYGDMISVLPFGNSISMVKASGQQILDALEYSCSEYPVEFGGFLQVSGVRFTVDTSIPTPVQLDNNGMVVAIEGDRRVSDVYVGDEPIDPEKQYTVAGVAYILTENGNGYTAFDGAELLLDEAEIDYQALINFIMNDLGGVVGEEYADPYGDGRIIFK